MSCYSWTFGVCFKNKTKLTTCWRITLNGVRRLHLTILILKSEYIVNWTVFDYLRITKKDKINYSSMKKLKTLWTKLRSLWEFMSLQNGVGLFLNRQYFQIIGMMCFWYFLICFKNYFHCCPILKSFRSLTELKIK